MTKPLSREKLENEIQKLYESLGPSPHLTSLRIRLGDGVLDEDAPAFDVDGLINSFSQRILYLQGLNKARKSNDPKYFEAKTIIRELSNQIVLIKQKLKKETEMEEELKPCPFCNGTSVSVMQYQEDDDSYYIVCNNKSCLLKRGTCPCLTKQGLITAWNTRAEK